MISNSAGYEQNREKFSLDSKHVNLNYRKEIILKLKQ